MKHGDAGRIIEPKAIPAAAPGCSRLVYQSINISIDIDIDMTSIFNAARSVIYDCNAAFVRRHLGDRELVK